MAARADCGGTAPTPNSATGDGVALGYEAGADVAGMEFAQFHPTALAVDGAPRFLISEAVRGEGAWIVNRDGKRFVLDVDPRGELAGRDVVARAIWDELQRSGEPCVFLDCSPLGARAAVRFPTIAATCARYGLDIARHPIPVSPAAHYMIGGVRTDLDGATSVPGLYACGEVAYTGVHGANRLASNSLLEVARLLAARGARRARLGGGIAAGSCCFFNSTPQLARIQYGSTRRLGHAPRHALDRCRRGSRRNRSAGGGSRVRAGRGRDSGSYHAAGHAAARGGLHGVAGVHGGPGSRREPRLPSSC